MYVTMPYNGALTAEQFLFYEIRIVAKLYLDGKSIDEIIEYTNMIANGEDTAVYDEQSLRVMRLLDEARRQIGIDFGAGEAL